MGSCEPSVWGVTESGHLHTNSNDCKQHCDTMDACTAYQFNETPAPGGYQCFIHTDQNAAPSLEENDVTCCVKQGINIYIMFFFFIVSNTIIPQRLQVYCCFCPY